MIWLYILSVCIFETKAIYVCPPEKECDGKTRTRHLYRSPENKRSERSLVSKIVVIDKSLLRKYEILIFSQDSCIICILKVVQGFYHCAGSGNAEEVLNCILDFVGATYSHCNECICWIICLIGPTTEECQRCSGSK